MALEYDLVLHAGMPYEMTLEGRPADPHNCYLLQKVAGLDGRALTEEVDPLAGADGDVLGTVTTRGTVVVIEGKIVAPTRALLRQRERNLRVATRGTTATWTMLVSGRSGDPEPLRIDVRTTQPLVAPDDGTDGTSFYKEFQVAVRSDSPTLRGQADQSQTLRPPDITTGLRFPFRFPLRFGGMSSAGTVQVLNDGDAASWPTLRVYGRTVNPVIENLSSGEAIYITATVEAGQYLEIDPRRRLVTLNGDAGASRYAVVRRDATRWWPLYPGSNVVRMSDAEHDSNARTEMRWADAYL